MCCVGDIVGVVLPVHFRCFIVVGLVMASSACAAGRNQVASGTVGVGGGTSTQSGSGAGDIASASSGGGSLNLGSGGAGGSPKLTTCENAAMQLTNATCKLTVTIDKFDVSSMACWVDAPFMVGDKGQLSFACGAGPAKLEFPKGAFSGTSSKCGLMLTRTTQFKYVDGCTWQSDQSISGSLDGKLQFKYTEKPIMGSPCASPCTVDGVLSLGELGPLEVQNPK
jgi:hypothetical protein